MARIVLIGAGSAQFGLCTLGEIFHSTILAGSEVVLHDINPKALKYVADTAQAFVQEHRLPFTVSASSDRKAAVAKADLIAISIEVGNRFALWDQDRTIPQHYGIRQVYGENGGPGGLFHSLRVIPPILEICEDVSRYSPEAFVFNYSNPMSRICTAVLHKYPNLRFVGLCHEVASLERYLPKMLGVSYENLALRAGGLNHFSCLLQAAYRDNGRDAYADIRAKADEFFARLPGSSDFLDHYLSTGKTVGTEGWREIEQVVTKSARPWTERKLFKFVLDNLGLLPITTDSHFGEYLAWAYDVVDQRGILDFYRHYREMLANLPAKIELRTHERMVPMFEALLTGSEYEEAAVNVPNRDHIRELPPNIAVEVPAIVNKSGVHGVALPPLPPAYAGILQNQIAIHLMTSEAVLSRSKRAVVQALLVDPIVDRAACLPELVDEMISHQRPYLDYLE